MNKVGGVFYVVSAKPGGCGPSENSPLRILGGLRTYSLRDRQ